MDEESAPDFIQVDEHDTGSRNGSCRRKLLFVGRVLLHLGCAAYCLYLIWLLAYLKDNPYYWFLALIPFFFNLMFPFMFIVLKNAGFLENIVWRLMHNKIRRASSASVVWTSMICFTPLTRLAYYHRQPDEFIGPRFIILSLEGSIILIFLDFFLQREGKLEILLNYKDALTRMLLDFVDIFNMVELLSANKCFGVGLFVSEESSMENIIQNSCRMSFLVVWVALNPLKDEDEPEEHHSAEQKQSKMEKLYTLITVFSGLYQNLPFFVIRIVVWAQYNLYSLGFLVKNFIVIVLSIGLCRKNIYIKRVRHRVRALLQLARDFYDGYVAGNQGPLRGRGWRGLKRPPLF